MGKPGKTILLLGILAIVVVTVSTLVISSRISGERALETHTENIMQRVVSRAVEDAESLLAPAEEAANVTAGLIGSFADNPAADATGAIEQYFLLKLQLNPSLAGLYEGRPDGGFVFVQRNNAEPGAEYRTKVISIQDGERTVELVWRDQDLNVLSEQIDPEDVYDPRVRPWYIEAVARNDVIWTDPYVFFTSRQPGITTATPVWVEGELHGVAGVDIDLHELSGFLHRLQPTPDASVFLLDTSGDVIAAHGAPAVRTSEVDGDVVRLSRADEVLDRPLANAIAGIAPEDGQLFTRYRVEGNVFVALIDDFTSGGRTWTIGVAAPEDDFLGDIRSSQRRNVWIAVGVGLAAMLLAIPLTIRVTRPIDDLHGRAITDHLTGLFNRHQLFDLGETAVDRARSNNRPMAVAMIDVDLFKAVNDQYGHGTGDEVLKAVAQRLEAGVRATDIVARYGGEEFVIVFSGTDIDTALEISHRLVERMAATPIRSSRGAVALTISLGLAPLDMGGQTFEELVHEADVAMLDAKRAGRNRAAVAARRPATHSL